MLMEFNGYKKHKKNLDARVEQVFRFGLEALIDGDKCKSRKLFERASILGHRRAAQYLMVMTKARNTMLWRDIILACEKNQR